MALDNLRSTLLEIGEPRQLVVTCPNCGDNKIIMARQVKKEEVETNPAFAEFLQVSRTNSPSGGFVRHPSRTSRRSSCRHRGTPGHKCNKSMNNVSSSSNDLSAAGNGGNMTTATATTSAKNGSNGRANSIHLMDGLVSNGEKPSDITTMTSWREKWLKFMEERDNHSLWLFPPDHRYSSTETKKYCIPRKFIHGIAFLAVGPQYYLCCPK